MATQTATVQPIAGYGGEGPAEDPVYVIRLASGKVFETTAGGRTRTAFFDERHEAQAFIDRGEHIAVEVLNLREVLKAAGWDDALGYTAPENVDRFRAHCAAEGIHYYAADRETFSRYGAVREAQRLGLSKLVMEDLS